MRMDKFDPSIPRWKYWSDEIEEASECPRCGRKLEKELHLYMLVIRDSRGYIPDTYGSDDLGYFCPECPMVVIDRETAGSLLKVPGVAPPMLFYSVVGIVDMNSIFENNNFHEIKMPPPVTRFTNLKEGKQKRQDYPAVVRVQTEVRFKRIVQICEWFDWELVADIAPDEPEDVSVIDLLFNPPQPLSRSGPKTGRNAPCPCGSGKKYKKCCLRRQ